MNQRQRKKAANQYCMPVEEDSKVMKNVKLYGPYITVFLALVTAIYTIVNYIYDYTYKSRCEIFYNIPGHYFSTSINSKFVRLFYIVLLLLICSFPDVLWKYEVKRGKQSKGKVIYFLLLSVMMGTVLGLFNVCNLLDILGKTHFIIWNKKYDFFVGVSVIVMGSLTLAGMTFRNEIFDIKCKWLKGTIAGIWTIIFIANIVLLCYGTVLQFSGSIDDVTRYEVVVENENEYVVLSTIDNSLLVVPYVVTREKEYVFRTKHYRLINRENCEYSYVDTGEPPIIDKE